tara:strand:- start:122 stop:373 length:252 start_codon:yes stop_codon:yes gene_type:complete
MGIGRLNRPRIPSISRKGRVGLNNKRDGFLSNKPRRAKKLQGQASFNKSLQDTIREEFNTGGYASIQEMEKYCGSKTTNNSMK